VIFASVAGFVEDGLGHHSDYRLRNGNKSLETTGAIEDQNGQYFQNVYNNARQS
jgi:hypothetical protein